MSAAREVGRQHRSFAAVESSYVLELAHREPRSPQATPPAPDARASAVLRHRQGARPRGRISRRRHLLEASVKGAGHA
jgi:hypothetical protein